MARRTLQRSQAQRGVSAVLLVAMIVFLAMLTTFTLHFVGATQGAQTKSVALARVKQAARTGLEWQRYKLRTGASPANAVVCPATGAPAANLTVPLSGGNVVVTVVCARTPNGATTHTEGLATVYTYSYTATACWPGPSAGSCPEADPNKGPDYVEYTLSGQAACSTSGAASTCTW